MKENIDVERLPRCDSFTPYYCGSIAGRPAICNGVNMKLSKAIGLHGDSSGVMISFVGGGGKTSSILTLAKELANEGKKVLITTTTAMYHIEGEIHPNISILGDHVTNEGKLKGITKERANEVYKEEGYDFILIEGDGSRGRPIKAPAEHEPVVPESTNILIGVIGMDAFGQEVSSSFVHRSEILAELTQTKMEEIVDEEVIFRLVSDPMGLFKNCPPCAVKILLLNKAIDTSLKGTALRIGNRVIDQCNNVDRVLIGTVLEEEPVKELLLR